MFGLIDQPGGIELNALAGEVRGDDVFPAGGIHHRRNRIVNGLNRRIGQIDHSEVCSLFQFQTSQVPGQSQQTLRSAKRCHAESVCGIQRVEPTGTGALHENGFAHLLEHIDDVVAGDTVGSETHPDSDFAHFDDPRNAVPELRIRFRTMHDRGSGPPQNVEVAIFDANDVNQQRIRVKRATTIQVRDRAATGHFDVECPFAIPLRQWPLAHRTYRSSSADFSAM